MQKADVEWLSCFLQARLVIYGGSYVLKIVVTLLPQREYQKAGVSPEPTIKSQAKSPIAEFIGREVGLYFRHKENN